MSTRLLTLIIRQPYGQDADCGLFLGACVKSSVNTATRAGPLRIASSQGPKLPRRRHRLGFVQLHLITVHRLSPARLDAPPQ